MVNSHEQAINMSLGFAGWEVTIFLNQSMCRFSLTLYDSGGAPISSRSSLRRVSENSSHSAMRPPGRS